MGCCGKRERWIKHLQGRVKFIAIAFSVFSLLGLCILCILYFSKTLPIVQTQLATKVIYVGIAIILNVMLYHSTCTRNLSLIKIWLICVMMQICVAVGYGIFGIYVAIRQSSSKLVVLPVLYFIFAILHLYCWFVVLKFLREQAFLIKADNYVARVEKESGKEQQQIMHSDELCELWSICMIEVFSYNHYVTLKNMAYECSSNIILRNYWTVHSVNN